MKPTSARLIPIASSSDCSRVESAWIDPLPGNNKKRVREAVAMGRKIEPKFFECIDCENATLLGSTTSESTCPGCGSANGRVISISELERRIEEGVVLSIDLSPRA